MSSAEELKAIALAEFAIAGYAATPLSRIAELAGLSKSSVLYHFASKEALLEAAVAPAIDRMAGIVRDTASRPFTPDWRSEFIAGFVDFLLEHRLEVNIFINQGSSLIDVPVVDQANELVVQLAEYFHTRVSNTEEKMRFGIALGGAAYMLCSLRNLELSPPPLDETRAALITIMTELLAPIDVPTAPQE